MYNEAIAEFEKERGTGILNLGFGYAASGRKAEAQKILDQLTHQSEQEYVPPKNVALIYAALGEKDKAFEWLEKSYQDRSICVALGVKSLPGFDPLRSDPRFKELLRRMNLQP
jgi:tetratricopeptide (TPR) repeat protein